MKLKPDELQERMRAATARLLESNTIEDADRAQEAVKAAMGELEELGKAEVEQKVEIREREVPAKTGDADVDALNVTLRETAEKAAKAQADADSERTRAEAAEEKVTGYERAAAAAKVLREADVEREDAERWLPELVRLSTGAEMKRLVEGKLAEREAILAKFQESISGIEGAGPRAPQPQTGGQSLAGILGVDPAELAPAEAAA